MHLHPKSVPFPISAHTIAIFSLFDRAGEGVQCRRAAEQRNKPRKATVGVAGAWLLDGGALRSVAVVLVPHLLSMTSSKME